MLDKIKKFLLNKAFQFNHKKYFLEDQEWESKILNSITNKEPIEIVIPMFCVISNPIKRIQPTIFTAAEEVTLRHLINISDLLSKIYAPGLIFHIITDSTFYAVPFGVSMVEAYNYHREIVEFVANNNLSSRLKVYDITHLLSSNINFFNIQYAYWMHALSQDPMALECDRVTYRKWCVSMMFCMNTKNKKIGYEDLANIFSKESVKSQAESVLLEYRALKAAANDMRWENNFFSKSLRATIHLKKLPVLGLKIYPEYKSRSTYLPYHGIGVVKKDVMADYYLIIEPELAVHNNVNYERIIDENGNTMFYMEL